MIAIGGYYGRSDIAAEIAELREPGLAGMKFKVGGPSPEEDAERVRPRARAAGDDFVLAVDANQGWTPQEAIRFARLVADFGLRGSRSRATGTTTAARCATSACAAGVAVCAGQSEFSAGGCRDLMVDGAIDVCNFDASWSGGPTEWRRVAAMAPAFDVQMAHHEEPQVAAHLLAGDPNGTFLEFFHPDRDPIWWNLIANRPAIVDGGSTSRRRPASAGSSTRTTSPGIA